MVHKILKQVKFIKKDERGALEPYKHLKALVPYKKDKKIISGIMKDERRHYKDIDRLGRRYGKLGIKLRQSGRKDID